MIIIIISIFIEDNVFSTTASLPYGPQTLIIFGPFLLLFGLFSYKTCDVSNAIFCFGRSTVLYRSKGNTNKAQSTIIELTYKINIKMSLPGSNSISKGSSAFAFYPICWFFYQYFNENCFKLNQLPQWVNRVHTRS